LLFQLSFAEKLAKFGAKVTRIEVVQIRAIRARFSADDDREQNHDPANPADSVFRR
jgi:hypothetical protein